MKAAIYKESDGFLIKEIEKPALISQGATIKVLGCGLCGSDIVKMKQKLVKNGAVLGHEVVGQIVEINSSNCDFKIGDKVVLGHHVPCFNCVFCKGENYSMCKTFKATNIIPGGFCEYIYVSDEHLKHTVIKIPQKVADIKAAFTEPLACCLRAVKRSEIKKGSNVIVIGLGSIGILIAQLAKHFGANVYGCDLLDKRILTAQKLGINDVIKFENDQKSSELYKKISKAKEGADCVFLASGANSSLSFAPACVRDGGKIVVFSSVSSSQTGFTNNDIYYRELTVLGSYSPAPIDLHESFNLIQKGIIKLDGLCSQYNINEIGQAVNDTLSNKIMKAYINISNISDFPRK